MRNILCIETSIGKCSVALSHDGLEDYVEASEKFVQSEQLFPLIEKILQKHGLTYKDLDLIACTLGPGSFTGLRIGIAAVKGIKKALPNIRLIGVSTLEAMVLGLQLPVVEQKILAALNAYGGELYAQKFDSNGRSLGPIHLISKDQMEETHTNTLLLIEQDSIDRGQGIAINLTARTLLKGTKEILLEKRAAEYESILPLYIKEPNITAKKR